MPQRLRDILLEGMRTQRHGWFHDIIAAENAFSKALLHRTRSKFRFTREVRSALVELIAQAVYKLGIQQDSISIADRFIDSRFVEGFYEEEDARRSARRSFRVPNNTANNQPAK
jgi:hypothetical protein